MQLIDYLDFGSIFEKVKKNHLEQYPTKESYINENEGIIEDLSFVNDLYIDLLSSNEVPYFGEREFPSSNSHFDNDLIDLEKNTLIIELSVGGNNATENGDDYWGVSWVFEVDLEEEIFINYYTESF